MQHECYFGEWVEYDDEEDKIAAHSYLQLWKRFFLKKVPSLEFVEDQIIDRFQVERQSILGAIGPAKNTLGIKIRMKSENKFSPDEMNRLPVPL